MAELEEIEVVLADLIARFGSVDADQRRALLPSRRLIELELSDLHLAFHAVLERGELGPVTAGPALHRPDIRVSGASDDLLDVARGHLPLGIAYASGRVRVEASMVDMLRMRALL